MKYNIKKIITLIISLLFTSVLTFTAFQVIPGDSALSALGMDATEEQLEEYREAMGLNKSLPVRYINWLNGALKGDFGYSSQYQMQMKVSTLIRNRLTVTLWLAVLSFLLIVVVSIPLGILSAKKKERCPGFFNYAGDSDFYVSTAFFFGHDNYTDLRHHFKMVYTGKLHKSRRKFRNFYKVYDISGHRSGNS